jgi:phage tail tape-measure protein
MGAKFGAAAGSFIPIPVVGTLGGALVGGAVGAFVGSKAGKLFGRGVKEGAEALVDGAKDVWDSVFG